MTVLLIVLAAIFFAGGLFCFWFAIGALAALIWDHGCSLNDGSSHKCFKWWFWGPCAFFKKYRKKICSECFGEDEIAF